MLYSAQEEQGCELQPIYLMNRNGGILVEGDELRRFDQRRTQLKKNKDVSCSQHTG